MVNEGVWHTYKYTYGLGGWIWYRKIEEDFDDKTMNWLILTWYWSEEVANFSPIDCLPYYCHPHPVRNKIKFGNLEIFKKIKWFRVNYLVNLRNRYVTMRHSEELSLRRVHCWGAVLVPHRVTVRLGNKNEFFKWFSWSSGILQAQFSMFLWALIWKVTICNLQIVR